jgi:hypothetical protein
VSAVPTPVPIDTQRNLWFVRLGRTRAKAVQHLFRGGLRLPSTGRAVHLDFALVLRAGWRSWDLVGTEADVRMAMGTLKVQEDLRAQRLSWRARIIRVARKACRTILSDDVVNDPAVIEAARVMNSDVWTIAHAVMDYWAEQAEGGAS